MRVDVFLAGFWSVMERTLYGRKHHRTQPGACSYDSSILSSWHSSHLNAILQLLVGSQISSCHRLDATKIIFHTDALYLLTLSVRGPNFSSFSLSCIRIILQHLTLFEPRCVVALPASSCASDSPAGLWLSNHLGRKQRLQSRRSRSTALRHNAINFREKF